ncbi:MAG: hypothetical protein ACKVH8_08550 [Pirellulales bacterium]|jgi:hypothetical protein
MCWEPISEAVLWDNINDAFMRMNPQQRKVWELIKITPEKWQEETYGKVGGGFWVVAIIGFSVVWYNDIEDGYNQSRYQKHGVIEEYSCHQDELEWAVQNIINMLSL